MRNRGSACSARARAASEPRAGRERGASGAREARRRPTAYRFVLGLDLQNLGSAKKFYCNACGLFGIFVFESIPFGLVLQEGNQKAKRKTAIMSIYFVGGEVLPCFDAKPRVCKPGTEDGKPRKWETGKRP